MAVILDIRNPNDLEETYDQIEIERDTVSTGASMANIATVNIDETTANDLSTGFTEYLDANGTVDTHYYRYRYKNSSSLAVSSYSDIYLAGTTVVHTKFRNRMRDTNSSNYYFSNSEITDFLQNAINKLYPWTYNEVIDETLTTLASTEKYTIPLGIFRVNEVELVDSSGIVVSKPSGYKKRARQLIFDNTPPTGYTIRLYADKQFQSLGEVPGMFDDLIIDLMQLEAMQTFEMDRSKYYRYTTVTNPEGGNLPSLSRVIERLEITTNARLNKLKRVRRATDMKLI